MSNTFAVAGNVGKDPVSRTSSNGKQVVTFSVASKTGKDKTSWFEVVCFGKTAEFVIQYIKKGSLVNVAGIIEIEKYEEKYYTKVKADRVNFLGGKKPETEAAVVSQSDDLDDAIPF